MLLTIDNYDSFTYNLIEYLKILNVDTQVICRDKINIDLIEQIKPQAILISPGPGNTSDCNNIKEIVTTYSKSIPFLGICLGHQIIASAFSSNIIKAPTPCHGKISSIEHSKTGIFKDVKSPLNVTRYHSLVVEKVPTDFVATAYTKDNLIMAMEHKSLPIYGLQFHPEALCTECGLKLLENFVNIYENRKIR